MTAVPIAIIAFALTLANHHENLEFNSFYYEEIEAETGNEVYKAWWQRPNLFRIQLGKVSKRTIFWKGDDCLVIQLPPLSKCSRACHTIKDIEILFPDHTRIAKRLLLGKAPRCFRKDPEIEVVRNENEVGLSSLVFRTTKWWDPELGLPISTSIEMREPGTTEFKLIKKGRYHYGLSIDPKIFLPPSNVPPCRESEFAFEKTIEYSLPESIGGIGVQITQITETVMVTRVFPQSPAEKAGVMVGDTIKAVEGKPVAGLSLSDVVKSITGPIGSPITLTVAGKEGVVRQVEMIRSHIGIMPLVP